MTLEAGQVYAWTMYPGYGDGPYRSPIMVEKIEPIGDRRFILAFLNLFYAPGVQRMSYLLRMLRREQTFIVAEQLDDGKRTDRVVIVEQISRKWMREYAQTNDVLLDRLLDSCFRQDRPDPDAFRRLASSI